MTTKPTSAADEHDTAIRRKIRAIAQQVVDELREQGKPVPDHTQAILEGLDAVLAKTDEGKPMTKQPNAIDESAEQIAERLLPCRFATDPKWFYCHRRRLHDVNCPAHYRSVVVAFIQTNEQHATALQVERERALDMAAAMIEGWHFKKGGFLELAFQVRALAQKGGGER